MIIVALVMLALGTLCGFGWGYQLASERKRKADRAWDRVAHRLNPPEPMMVIMEPVSLDRFGRVGPRMWM